MTGVPGSSPAAAAAQGGGEQRRRVVQLHFGRFVHPIYREQMHAVPDGFAYRADHPALADETTPTKRIVEQRARLAGARTLAERAALRVLSRAGYVHRVRVRPLGDAELIHSAERLLRGAPLPYVLDFEHAELFVLYQRVALRRPWARAVLARGLEDERLRFLLPWSEMAGRSLGRALGRDVGARLQAKTRVVYPALRLSAERPPSRSPGEQLRVLFVGTAFYEKGGVEAIRAVQRAAATHDVHLDLVSYVPDDWARCLQEEPAITAHRPGGADVVQALYRRAHVLLFPSHMDTFGWVAIEAMSHGLPVLAPRYLTQAELVRDGATGLLFAGENPLYGEDTACRFPSTLPPPRRFLDALRAPSEAYVDGIAAAIGRLAEDRDLHAGLAAAALEEVAGGRFSLARRREALGEIYAAALA